MLHTKMLICFLIQTIFHHFHFCGPHTKPHGVRELSKHYYIQFDNKIGHNTLEISRIPYACSEYTFMIDKPWIRGLTSQQQPCYQPVIYLNHWPVLGSFNKWNIITFSQKTTTSETFEDIYQVVFNGIIDNMDSLVQYCKYGSINTTYTSTIGYYIIDFVSEEYTLQYVTTCEGPKKRLVI